MRHNIRKATAAEGNYWITGQSFYSDIGGVKTRFLYTDDGNITHWETGAIFCRVPAHLLLDGYTLRSRREIAIGQILDRIGISKVVSTIRARPVLNPIY